VRLIAVFILAAWASLAQSADISVRVQGGPANGVLVFQVYDSPNAFGDFRDPVKEVRAPIDSRAQYLIDDVPAGDVAVLSKGFQAGAFRILSQLQVNWLSAELPNYDYGVAASAATVTRPAYDTGSSISYEAGIGTFIELTEDSRILLTVAAEFLPNEISDSPIVAEDRVIKGFAAITYVF
jgi:hypothetical protein